jgi:hypothetical protein
LAFLILKALPANSQEIIAQPTPSTALVDFSLLQPESPSKPELPPWIESVQLTHNHPPDILNADLTSADMRPQSTYRLRLRNARFDPTQGLLLRLFFYDDPKARPTITGWSETGDQVFYTIPLGAGLDMPASESLRIPTQGVDYLEITVAGDGSTIQKAFISPLTTTPVQSATDFAEPPGLVDPFEAPAKKNPSINDTLLYGRVRATLAQETIKLYYAALTPLKDETSNEEKPSASKPEMVQFVFNLEAAPLMAMITFDILNADPAAPLNAFANTRSLGGISMVLPDLADPAYTGAVRPLDPLSFIYTGWIRCQKIIPGSLLRAGQNTFTLLLPEGSKPVALRAVEIQLKNHWQKFDYSLDPL